MRHMKRSALIITIIATAIAYANAQDTIITAKELGEVIVTYQADVATPVTYQNIDAGSIDTKSVGQEPSFIFSETPSITNYSDGGGSQGYSYIRLRGIDQTRINVTLDGVPLSEPEDQGSYFSNYPDILNSVSRIQIQRGVGTTKNGSANYGGSIQLFSPNLNDTTALTIGMGYGSFNSVRLFGEYNSGVRKRKALYVRASHVYSDGYKYSSSNNSQSVFLSSAIFGDNSIWKLNFMLGSQMNDMAWIGVSDSLINIDRRTNGNTRVEKDRFTQLITQLQNQYQIARRSSLQSSIYYTFQDGNYGFDLNNYLGLPSTDELYNYAFRSNLVGGFVNYTYSNKRFNSVTGLHGNVYNRTHTGSEKNTGVLYVNTGFKNEVSVFTKADYIIKWLTLFCDVQYRHVGFDYDGATPFKGLKWNFINPKGGVSTKINGNALLYYSIGSSNREPTRNDMFGGNDDLIADSLNNPVIFNTKAEYVLDHELGFRYNKGRVDLNVNLYYMDFKNEIVLNGKFGPNGLALTNNVEQSLRTGVELSVRYAIGKHLSLTNNSSFNYSHIKERGEVFTPILTPPLIINQDVTYTGNRFSISLNGRYQSSSFIDFANTHRINGYFLLNTRVSYTISGVTASLFINNITNQKYFNNGYVDFDGTDKYFVQAPINFYVSVQCKF